MSGDIQPNPGPIWKYPCGVCNKPVKINQKGVQCDKCDQWYHTKCCSMSDETYNTVANTSYVWLCVNCDQPSFSQPDSSLDLDSRNSFSILSQESPSTGPPDLSAQSSTPQSNSSQHQRLLKRQPKDSLKVMSINCRSLRSSSKRVEFSTLVEIEKPDIIFGCESHLDSCIHTSEIFPSNYEIFRKDRVLGAGGVFLAIHERYASTDIPELASDCEAAWAKLKIHNSNPLYLCSFYRPPDNDIDPLIALDEMLQKLYTLTNGSANILLSGDFNLPDIDWSQGCLKQSCNYTPAINYKMLDIARDNYISQVNRHPTREANMLDLLFVTNPDLVTNIRTGPGMSDHDIVLANVDFKAEINKKPPRYVNVYSKANWSDLKSDLNNYQHTFFTTNPHEKSIEENWKSLKDAVSKATIAYIPQKKISSRWNLPYLTNELKRKIRKKHRRYKKSQTIR